MAPPTINLDLYRDEIEQRLLQSRQTHAEVLAWLETQGVTIAPRTLKRRCKEWGATRRATVSDAAVIAQVEEQYFSTHKDDEAIASALETQGLYISARQVRDIRMTNGWLRRTADATQIAEQRTETFARVQAALEEGTCRSYGRGFLQSYLRLNGYIAREDDVRDALAFHDAQGTQARRRGPDKRRTDGEFITPGPDFLWCCDGHDKFRNYGIEIYAAVDAYSRRIQWIYVGNSNRRQISVLRQMLDALRHYNRCPSFWRTDRGKEVLLLADSHFSFFRKHKQAEGATPEQVEALRFRDCFMFGTSTANIKVESVWMRMLGSQTRPWLVGSISLVSLSCSTFFHPKMITTVSTHCRQQLFSLLLYNLALRNEACR
jgi:hypothetical protein